MYHHAAGSWTKTLNSVRTKLPPKTGRFPKSPFLLRPPHTDGGNLAPLGIHKIRISTHAVNLPWDLKFPELNPCAPNLPNSKSNDLTDPIIRIILTLGPKVCKYYLHWAIWIPSIGPDRRFSWRLLIFPGGTANPDSTPGPHSISCDSLGSKALGLQKNPQ